MSWIYNTQLQDFTPMQPMIHQSQVLSPKCMSGPLNYNNLRRPLKNKLLQLSQFEVQPNQKFDFSKSQLLKAKFCNSFRFSCKKGTAILQYKLHYCRRFRPKNGCMADKPKKTASDLVPTERLPTNRKAAKSQIIRLLGVFGLQEAFQPE